MSALESIAAFVCDLDIAAQAASRLDLVRLHILDSIGAMVAGFRLRDQAALAGLRAISPLPACCAAARCGEIDDIHVESCTTPGAVIVPTALSLAAAGELSTWGELLAAVLAGYEVLIRMGWAIDGARVLEKKVWPTFFAAPVGSAAVACRALRLSAPQTAGALSTALSFATGTASPARSSGSSRWLSVGIAASDGVMAARAAAGGLSGTADLLERYEGRIAGVDISEQRLCAELGESFLFDAIETKPYAVARQALAAIEAARQLHDAGRFDFSSISEVVVRVPALQRRVIDHPAIPNNRMESITSVQYQVALALSAPEKLHDFEREPPFVDNRIRELGQKVRVEIAPELDRYYPATWPGQVIIESSAGAEERTVLNPGVQGGGRVQWDRAVEKLTRLAGLSDLPARLRSIEPEEKIPPELCRLAGPQFCG
jgi:2-methylcitrate dehydratase PrpD